MVALARSFPFTEKEKTSPMASMVTLCQVLRALGRGKKGPKAPKAYALESHHLLKTFSANPGTSEKEKGLPSTRKDPENAPKT